MLVLNFHNLRVFSRFVELLVVPASNQGAMYIIIQIQYLFNIRERNAEKIKHERLNLIDGLKLWFFKKKKKVKYLNSKKIVAISSYHLCYRPISILKKKVKRKNKLHKIFAKDTIQRSTSRAPASLAAHPSARWACCFGSSDPCRPWWGRSISYSSTRGVTYWKASQERKWCNPLLGWKRAGFFLSREKCNLFGNHELVNSIVICNCASAMPLI